MHGSVYVVSLLFAHVHRLAPKYVSASVRACQHALFFFALSLSAFDVSLSWKGNTRTQPSQWRSHLCPLMIGQGLSRPTRDVSVMEQMHTQSYKSYKHMYNHMHTLAHAHTHSQSYFPRPFVVASVCYSDHSGCFCSPLMIWCTCSCYGDRCFQSPLGGWIDVMQRLCPCRCLLHHSALSAGDTGLHISLHSTIHLVTFVHTHLS